MSWGALRRRAHKHDQAADTEPDEHGVRASNERREREERRRALHAERDSTTRKNGQATLGFMSGPGPIG
jgi:hypothetical protein